MDPAIRVDARAYPGFFSFIGGIASLLVLIVVYIAVEERVALKVIAGILTVYTILPAFYRIWQLLNDAAASHGSRRGIVSGRPQMPSQATSSTNATTAGSSIALLPQHAAPQRNT
jgi:hypothetical protein